MFDFDLKEYLTTKHTLRFNEDGKFRILILADPHGRLDMHPQLAPGIDVIVNHVLPDLVLLAGDVTGNKTGCENKEQLRRCLDEIVAPMETRRIPWAHVFGNHDADRGLTNEEQQPVYESYSYCVSKRGPRSIHGVGNYVLPIFRSDSDDVAFNIWGFDTHNDMCTFGMAYGLPEDLRWHILPEHFAFGNHGEPLHTDQVLWYYCASKAIEAHFGRKIFGLMYLHMPLMEFCLIPRNPQQTQMTGQMREHVACSELNTGMFAACLQRGDVKAIFSGHDHLNDFCGVYCGIMLGQCAGINYDAGSADDLRGGRVVEIHQDDPARIHTFMVRLRSIMGEAADNRGRP
ncbi:MAG: hypothetical protein GX094_11410 [Clostridiales bacterium]|jgi:hypothetical protein|nr:hypothetical protein [Clostridiales bacterium]